MPRDVFLSPHHDDETLFGAYILLAYRPLVVVCFDGAARHGSREVRERETAEAMSVLGCEWVKLAEPLSMLLAGMCPSRVWAPLPEPDGNPDHNHVGEVALRACPGRVSLYTTYTSAGRTVGVPVPVGPGWPALKRRALACYRSQLALPAIRPHFERGLDEYLAAP